MKASLHVRKDIEIRCNHCGCLVNLVRASLSVRNYSESSFLHCGSPVKLFYARLSLMRDLESCFYYCESPVKVLKFIWVSGELQKAAFTIVGVLSSCDRAVHVSVGILKAVFTTVEVL